MIDHAARRQMELDNPEVAVYRKVVMAEIMNEITTAFRNNDLKRRDILTEVTTIINKVPIDGSKNPV